MLLGNNMYIMTQAPEKGRGTLFACTKMAAGSRHITVVIKNKTATLNIISKAIKVTQVVAANTVPPVEVAPGTLEKLDEMQGVQ